MNVIETVSLAKRYRNKWALRNCTLAVPSGRVVALVGPNGSGKTTFLHCVVGLCRPTTGSMTVMGDMAAGSLEALRAISFVAQNAPLLSHLTVRATISLSAALNYSFDRSLAEARLLELGIPPNRRVGGLSAGQQTQLALSLALARRPAVLVLDEPMAALDPLARHDFMAYLMGQVAEQGLSVIFSSHVVSELERVADYLIVLNEGTVQVVGNINDLLGAHGLWSGRRDQLETLRREVPVVFSEAKGRFASAVVRHTGARSPTNWESDPLEVEELILAYLRTPSAKSLPRTSAFMSTRRSGSGD